MQNLPIGIQNFEKLRNENLKYIDKTAILYYLVKSGCYYFLSRPRRFGKSLFLSTLEAYFQGKKELFHGLAIEQLEKDWNEYPVLHLDLNTEKYQEPEALDTILHYHLDLWEKQSNIKATEETLGLRFMQVIQLTYERTGKQVVILVDEYDKPILQAIDNPALQDAYRNTLKSFYGALKSCDQYIKFAFLTGVTKLGKVSVFSDLNNLRDISMEKDYHDICGITQDELHSNFNDYISRLSEEHELSRDETYTRLKEQYDGYHFCEDKVEGVYNPFSLLNCFVKRKFGSYWFETGTPSYLVELLKKHNYNLARLETEELSFDEINSIDSTSTNPIPVIYQSGYLTIKDYDKRFELYKLGFPNKEVKEGFLKFLIPFYAPKHAEKSDFEISNFVLSLERGKIEDFMSRLQSFMANCPYELQPEQERHFQTIMFLLTTLCGLYCEVESHTNKGRMDMTIKTDKYVYIFEFKFNATAEAALQQIHDKGYVEPYRMDERKIVCIGVNYSSEARNIDKWSIQ